MKELMEYGKITPYTYNRYLRTKSKVVEFMKLQYKINDIPLKDLRLSFVTELEHYLLTIDQLHSNTAHKYIKNLKKIINNAVDLEWMPTNPFHRFSCSYIDPQREVLSESELYKLINKKIDIPRLAQVRDVFVFCCYTGFAYADVYKFDQDSLTIGIDGEYWITTNREKTGTRESVPLLPEALKVVKRYSNHPDCIKTGKLLPVNSNQRYNAYLKELADICGIKKHVTTHIARHTFATTVTLSNGVPIETVSKMLGHKKLATTQIYAKVLDIKVSSDMLKLKSLLSSQTDQSIANTSNNKVS